MNYKESKLLRFLYHTVPGRVLLKVVTSPIISKIGGAYMNSKRSVRHINKFIQKNNINMDEYHIEDWESFDHFFTRRIRSRCRPIDRDEEAFVSPCDGRLSVYDIKDDTTFEIKGSHYTVESLLMDKKFAKEFAGGKALVFRLCVDDYHRYGYPADGRILYLQNVKGRLHTVRPIALEKYPVFIQNARDVSLIQTKNFDVIAQVEVGALMIGKIENHKAGGPVDKGDEKGMFHYGGSTIVILTKKGVLNIPEHDEEIKVKYGQRVNTLLR
ncbi:MAG: phosphatidylserine decarboxylase [Eubacterium sp.]|nr:phosphatidylserine decarboxylase [Eubacterium sp.]